MLAQPTFFRPDWAAFGNWAQRLMDVILHIGAHRTGTTSFQLYMRRQQEELATAGLAFWGPGRTRSKLFSGVFADDGAAAPCQPIGARLQRQLRIAREGGVQKLVISDENILGSVRCNIRCETLYTDAGARVARLWQAFEARIDRIMMSTRCLETYWCSALAYGVKRGAPLPERGKLARIALGSRGWREVITDVAHAAPGAEICVLPFEVYRGRSDSLLADGADVDAPFDMSRARSNRSPTLPELRRALHERGETQSVLPFGMGRWNPFTNNEHAALREKHADDLMWLTAGADGLATLTEDRTHERAGKSLPQGAHRKGQLDELEERQVARPG